MINRLYLSITNRCNLNCIHCFRGGSSAQEELSVYEYEKILLNARKILKSNQISITGGEPFIRKDIFDLLDVAERLQYNVDLSSNGLLLNEDTISKLEKYVNIFYLQISVDGITKPSYEFVRGDNTFEVLTHNLQMLSKSSFLDMIDLMMIFMVTPKNIDEIVGIPEFACQYRFDKVAIGEILPFGNGKSNYYNLDIKDRYGEVYKNILTARNKELISIVDQFHFGFLYSGEQPGPCTARQRKVFSIEPNGDLLFCPYDINLHLGNIRDYDYRIDVAYDDISRKYPNLFNPSGDEKCDYYESCLGGCPLMKNEKGCDKRCILLKP